MPSSKPGRLIHPFKPTSVRLHFRRDLPLDGDDFGAMMINGMLALPWDLHPICQTRNIHDSALFVALIKTDPRAVARAIGWDIPRLMKALQGLHKILEPVHGSQER